MKRKQFNFNDLVNLFLTEQELKGLSDSTIGIEKECLEIYSKFSNETTKEAFESFVQHLINLDWTISTKNKTLGHLRVFFYWLMNKGYCEQFKIRLLRGQEPTMKFFTKEEVNLLLKRPINTFGAQRMYTVCCLICRTGARLSTIRNLQLDDLNFKEKTITFRHLKNKKSVVLPMTDLLCSVLKQWTTTWDLDKYVFSDIYGNQMTVNNFETAFRRYCIDQGVKPRGPHRLRHAFRRMYIKAGGDAFSLQRIMTHASINTTKRYVELFTEDLRMPLVTFSPLNNMKRRVKRI